MAVVPKSIDYKASYTCQLFHASMKPIKCIRGPVGSGKSVACCFEIFRKSHYEQEVHEGMRWSQWLLGRNTFDDLKKTTIDTWLRWFPETKMHWSPPLEGRLEMPCCQNDGTIVRIDLLFYPLDKVDIIKSLKSLEISGAWINEATQTQLEVVDGVWDRLGRFTPAPNVLGSNLGLIMDTNSPDESNWWYTQEVIKKPGAVDFFVQPPGLLKKVDEKTGEVWYVDNDGSDPAFLPAENIAHLKGGFKYYHDKTLLGDEEKIKRDVLNQFSTTMDGKPVYPEYNDSIHYANKEIRFEPGLPLILGTDFGRTPSTVICQMGTNGQIRVLEEVLSDNMGVCQFVEEKLRPVLINKYRFPNIQILNWADPAGANPDQISEATCIMNMNRYGIKTLPSPVPQNAFQLRRDCVGDLLRSRRDKESAVLIGAGAPTLRQGMNGGYCYRRMRLNSTAEVYAERPDKTNMFTHSADAFQYACYGTMYGGVDFGPPGLAGAYASRQINTGVSLGGFGC